MNAYQLIIVSDKDLKSEFTKLYQTSALTFTGMLIEPKNLQAIADAFVSFGAKPPITLTVISGKQMSEFCKLTGTNKYANDLHFLSVNPYGNVLAMQVGARWFDDIVDNNAAAEGYHPLKVTKQDVGLEEKADDAKQQDAYEGTVTIEELDLAKAKSADSKIVDKKIALSELIKQMK